MKRLTNNTEKSALLVIDMQNDLITNDGPINKFMGYSFTTEQRSGLIDSCKTLIDKVRSAGVPIIYTQVTLRSDGIDSAFSPKFDATRGSTQFLVDGSWGAKFLDAIAPEQKDIILNKKGSSAFQFTHLHRLLRNLDVNSLVIIGGPIYSSINVTIRDGSALGYKCYVVREAIYPVDSPQVDILKLRSDLISIKEAEAKFMEAASQGLTYVYQTPNKWQELLSESCLLMIDLQNDFVNREGSFAKRNGAATGHENWFQEDAYKHMLAKNIELVEWAHEHEIPVIKIRVVLRPDGVDSALAQSPRHWGVSETATLCGEGTWGAGMSEELALTEQDIDLIKKGHSAFKFTHLDRMLANLNVKQCIVTGGGIGGCLDETILEGSSLRYQMVVVQDACFNPGDWRLGLLEDICEIVATDSVLNAKPGVGVSVSSEAYTY